MPKISKAEHLLLLTNIGTSNTSFFRKQALRSHPDKVKNAEEIFKSFNAFKEISQTPSSNVTYSGPKKLAHTYLSMMGPFDQQKSATVKITVAPLCYNKPEIRENIKQLYDLSNEQLEAVSQKLEQHILLFLQNILTMMKPSDAARVLLSHKLLEKDLILLLQNAEQNDTLSQAINELNTIPRASYSQFDSDIQTHLQKATSLINLFQQNPTFQNAVFKIYMHMAYVHTEPETVWQRYKKPIANGINIALKIPLVLLDAIFIIAIIGILSGIPLFFCSGLPAYLLGFLTLQWRVCSLLMWASLGLGMYTYKDTLKIAIDYVIALHNDLSNYLISNAQKIDNAIETKFDVKFFATDLAASFDQVQRLHSDIEACTSTTASSL
jgi:hypothetical protein